MKYATRSFLYVISAILFFYGVADVAAHVRDGGEIQWGAPLVLLGIGGGVPLVLISFPDFLVSDLSCESSGGSGYDSESCGGGDGGGD